MQHYQPRETSTLKGDVTNIRRSRREKKSTACHAISVDIGYASVRRAHGGLTRGLANLGVTGSSTPPLVNPSPRSSFNCSRTYCWFQALNLAAHPVPHQAPLLIQHLDPHLVQHQRQLQARPNDTPGPTPGLTWSNTRANSKPDPPRVPLLFLLLAAH
jgi:hypothetical protein